MIRLGRVLGNKLQIGFEVVSRTLSSFFHKIETYLKDLKDQSVFGTFGEYQLVRAQHSSRSFEINNRKAVYAPFTNTFHVTYLKYQQGS